MACNQNCNQGRGCNCDGKINRASVVVAVLFVIMITSMAYGAWRLITSYQGGYCAVEIQFKDSKATYIGHSV